MVKKLYLLSQWANGGYDTYDSCVVVATSAGEARLIRPDWYPSEKGDPWSETEAKYSSWAHKPEQVDVEYLGLAMESLPVGVVCSSFNAG